MTLPINVMVLCAVNCFAMISGYVGYGTKQKITNIIMLWLRVVFYSAGLAVTFSLFAPNYLGENWLHRSVFPVMSTQYWYFTAYVPVFFAAPLINSAVKNVSASTLKIASAASIILFCILPFVLYGDPFGLSGGYSPIWLMVCYFIGAVVKREESRIAVKPAKMGFFYLVIATVEWIMGISGIISLEISMNYSFIFNVMKAAALLLMFKDLHISKWLENVIRYLAPLVFSVYLIYDNVIVRGYFIKGLFGRVEHNTIPVMVFTIFVGAAGIFTVCILIDGVREFLFNKLQIKKTLIRFENKYLSE